MKLLSLKAERTEPGKPRNQGLGSGEPRATEKDDVPLANGHGRDTPAGKASLKRHVSVPPTTAHGRPQKHVFLPSQK